MSGIWADDMTEDDVKYTLRADDKACSLGLLRTAVFPAKELPEWANTVARRLKAMDIPVKRIKEIIEAMEIDRRAKVREELRAKTGMTCPRTEFDEHLADMLNRFDK